MNGMTSTTRRTSILFLATLLLAACSDEAPRPSIQAPAGAATGAWLEDVTTRSGIDFTHFAGATGEYHFPESIRAGGGLVDFDGDEDLFMTHLAAETNTLYLNDGEGNFFDSTGRLGLASGSLPYTGFGARWADLDNDGLLDLFIANGAVQAEAGQIGHSPFPYAQRNQVFHNLGGTRFEERVPLAEPELAVEEVSRGAAFGDVDNDGDLDILVTNANGPARLLLGRSPLALGAPAWHGVQPGRRRGPGRPAADRAAANLAPGPQRRQLPQRQRYPGPFRAGPGNGYRGRGRGLAERSARAVAGRGGRQPGGAGRRRGRTLARRLNLARFRARPGTSTTLTRDG
jgi:hypothetical protein